MATIRDEDAGDPELRPPQGPRKMGRPTITDGEGVVRASVAFSQRTKDLLTRLADRTEQTESKVVRDLLSAFGELVLAEGGVAPVEARLHFTEPLEGLLGRVASELGMPRHVLVEQIVAEALPAWVEKARTRKAAFDSLDKENDLDAGRTRGGRVK